MIGCILGELFHKLFVLAVRAVRVNVVRIECVHVRGAGRDSRKKKYYKSGGGCRRAANFHKLRFPSFKFIRSLYHTDRYPTSRGR